MAAQNTTRGVSFDPSIARLSAKVQTERIRKQRMERRVNELRAHGRMLDQIELCYKQHTPAHQNYAQ